MPTDGSYLSLFKLCLQTLHSGLMASVSTGTLQWKLQITKLSAIVDYSVYN